MICEKAAGVCSADGSLLPGKRPFEASFTANMGVNDGFLRLVKAVIKDSKGRY